MPVRKRQRIKEPVEVEDDGKEAPSIMLQLIDEHSAPTGSQLLVPASIDSVQLRDLLSTILTREEDKEVPYAFFVNGDQVSDSVQDILHQHQKAGKRERMLKEGRRVRPIDIEDLPFEVPEETVVQVMYRPQAVFKVRPVSRCSATLDGHSEAVLIVVFSPDGNLLATGGGDKEIRIWDVLTATPVEVLTGHKHWVQVIAWAPNGKYFASGSRDGGLLLWTVSADETKFKSQSLKGHTNYLSHIAWEPLHVNSQCNRFVSASKDMMLYVWKVGSGKEFCLSGHTACVTCVKWGGLNRMYSSSQDRTIIVWDATNGAQVCSLKGHAHWVNFIALSTDHVLRTGTYDHTEQKFTNEQAAKSYAEERFKKVVDRVGERIVSCSDDNTMMTWAPWETSKPLARLTGHQGIIFHIAFSPDGTMIASSSADKSVKIWNAITGKFVYTFRGHVAAVYHVSWSLDSRMLVSGSKDTTLKLWSISSRELVEDMGGHQDEVFSTDWSPDGQRVATGSKDKKVRFFVH